jgi:hypothetical protein
MKYKKNTFCLLMFMLAGVLWISPLGFAETPDNHTSTEEVKQETQELLKALKAYGVDQRDAASRKIKTALNKLDKRIDTLEARLYNNWDKMERSAREKARANLKALRKQRTQVAEWYGSMKSSSTEAWGHMKKGFSDAYRALSDAWEKSEKEFDSNP